MINAFKSKTKAIAVVSLLTVCVTSSQGTEITDNFIGGSGWSGDMSSYGYAPGLTYFDESWNYVSTDSSAPNGYVKKRVDDIEGPVGDYDLTKMVVNNSGASFTVDIYGLFFSKKDTLNETLGDLFLSTDGWNPYPDSTFDTFMNGESWDFALSFDQPTSGITSGTVSLYNTSEGGAIALSDDQGLSNYIGAQEVMFNPETDGSGNATQISYASGTWEIIGGDFLRYKFDYAPFLASDALGLRWTMNCANDIIEGEHNPVPEPSTLLLLSAGIFGLVGIRQIKK